MSSTDPVLIEILTDARRTLLDPESYRRGERGSETWSAAGEPLPMARSRKAAKWSVAGAIHRATANLAWYAAATGALTPVVKQLGFASFDAFNRDASHKHVMQVFDTVIDGPSARPDRLYLWTADSATGYLFRAPSVVAAERVGAMIDRKAGCAGSVLPVAEEALCSPSYELLSRKFPGLLAQAVTASDSAVEAPATADPNDGDKPGIR